VEGVQSTSTPERAATYGVPMIAVCGELVVDLDPPASADPPTAPQIEAPRR
jgi:hypothetical protein